MNERIRQLWDQASGEFCKQNPYATIMLPAPLREKFAELLEKEFEAKYFSAGYIQGRSDGTIETVRECIDIAEQVYCHSWDQEWRKELSDSIKQHFGVEE